MKELALSAPANNSIQDVTESLRVKTEGELLEALKGLPKNEAEEAYLPLETVKLTNETNKNISVI